MEIKFPIFTLEELNNKEGTLTYACDKGSNDGDYTVEHLWFHCHKEGKHYLLAEKISPQRTTKETK